MWPLLFFSVAAAAIILERAACFLRRRLRFDGIKDRTARALAAGDLAGARDYLAGLGGRHLAARVLRALLSRPGLSEQAAEAEARDCVNSLESGFSFLVALGSLAPLTGFLGTVSGMIGAFRSIAAAAEVNAQIVAGGIYEALITTEFGLVIAIAAMAAHAVFSAAVDRFAAAAEKACADLIARPDAADGGREPPP
jgi:biopolymer transport protein ExbB